MSAPISNVPADNPAWVELVGSICALGDSLDAWELDELERETYRRRAEQNRAEEA